MSSESMVQHSNGLCYSVHGPDIVEWCTAFVETIGDEAFFLQLPEYLQAILPHEYCMIFYYKNREAPIALFDGLTPEGYGDGVTNYVRETFVINPFYRAIERGLGAGVHSMSDLALQIGTTLNKESELRVERDNREELGFVTEGWPKRSKEVMLGAPIGNGDVVEISMSTPETKRRGESPDVLDRLSPFIVTGIRKHVQIRPAEIGNQADHTSRLLEHQKFRNLTKREIEIVDLILSGLSSKVIAMHLDIALPTVKTHRRNIFRKLKISAQAELFALATSLLSH